MRARVEERTYFPWSVKEPLLKQTGGRCAHCGIPLDRYTNLSVDHVIPLNKGGTNDPVNLTVLCDECNTKKSDMILPPMNWYGYLSVARRKELTAYMKKYMQETDYLAEDCLMPMDTFRLEVPITVKKNRGPNIKMIRMPAYIQGIRISREDAFEWLMNYKSSLQYRDACGTIEHPSEFTTPCYLLKKGGIEVAMVNPWMMHRYDEGIGNYRNEIGMDWFFSPKLPQRDYMPDMLGCMVIGLETYISGSIADSMEGAGVVLFRIRCFLSDRFCEPVFDRIKKNRDDTIEEFGKNRNLPARIRELAAFRLVGERKACSELKRKMDKMYPDKYITMEEAMKLCGDFNKRFKEEDE